MAELGKRGGAGGGVGYVVEPSDKRSKPRGSGLKSGIVLVLLGVSYLGGY